MSAEPKPKPTPTPMTAPASHNSDLALETEPLVFFHPTLVGRGIPGKVQPVPHSLLLEEEPATWPELDGE
jgi:hypothetical protein